MKGPALVVFTIDTPGWSFHEPVKNGGRLIEVFQSTLVSNVWLYNTRRTPPALSGSTNSFRALDDTSEIVMLLAQFQRPMRIGVWNEMFVARSPENRCSVSAAVSPGTSTVC